MTSAHLKSRYTHNTIYFLVYKIKKHNILKSYNASRSCWCCSDMEVNDVMCVMMQLTRAELLGGTKCNFSNVGNHFEWDNEVIYIF